MGKLIDCRGMACPKPVITTKMELDNIGEGTITTIVDNETAKENLSRLAKGMNLGFSIDEKSKEEYHVKIVKGLSEIVEDASEAHTKTVQSIGKVVAIGSNKMGSGDEKLGKILMKSFIYTVRETKPYPSSILLFNSGVYLSCEDSEVLDDLQFLESQGVDIQSCGTCLDFYELKEKLAVGGVSNMYSIYEKMSSGNIINIG